MIKAEEKMWWEEEFGEFCESTNYITRNLTETTTGIVLVKTEDHRYYLLSMLEAARQGYVERLPAPNPQTAQNQTNYKVNHFKVITVFQYTRLTDHTGKLIDGTISFAFQEPDEYLFIDIFHFHTLANEVGLDPNIWDFKSTRALTADEVEALYHVFGLEITTWEPLPEPYPEALGEQEPKLFLYQPSKDKELLVLGSKNSHRFWVELLQVPSRLYWIPSRAQYELERKSLRRPIEQIKHEAQQIYEREMRLVRNSTQEYPYYFQRR